MSKRHRHGRAGPGRPLAFQGKFRGLIPSLFIRVSRVVRFNPMRAAAPSAPPTRPLVSFKICTILSCSSKSSARAGGVFMLPSVNSGTEIASLSVGERTTARSTRFSSSRTFPGQCQLASLRRDDAGMVSIFFCIRRAYFCVKYRTSKGMSSGRSRKGGIRMGTTFRR